MPGVCLCHKEIDRFPSSSTAPKSEILGFIPCTERKSKWFSKKFLKNFNHLLSINSRYTGVEGEIFQCRLHVFIP